MDIIIGLLQSTFQDGFIWAILALGVFIAYRVCDIADLSVEGTFPLGACLSIILLNNGVNPFLAIILAVCGGVLAGMLTALLHTACKIPSLLSGIIVMTALYSLNLLILGGKANVQLKGSKTTIFTPLSSLFGSNIWGIIITLTILTLLIFAFLYWFFGTEIGVALRATGKNNKMTKAQGINTTIMIIVGLAISNGLVALSGALYSQSSIFADVTLGNGKIVTGLAAVIIGEAIFGRRSFKNHLISIILGGLVYTFIIALAIELDFDPNYLKFPIAIIIVAALVVPQIIKNIKTKRRVTQ